LSKELSILIDSTKANSINDGLFAVYIIRLSYPGKRGDGICATLGYIMNSYEFNRIKAEYYFYYENQVVMVRGVDSESIKYFDGFDLKEVNSYDDSTISIVQRLYPRDLGMISYKPKGTVICIKERCRDIIITKYPDAFEVPKSVSIYDLYPSLGNAIIEEIDLKK